MNKKPNLAALFGANSSKTFLGLPQCKKLDKIDASSVFIGAPCATPYKTVGPYAKNGPASIRKAGQSLNSNIDRHNFDIEGPLFPKGSKKAVDCGDIKWDNKNYKKNRLEIKNSISKIIKCNAVPILVGGDDSVPIPMIQAMSNFGDNFTILQIDAHIDWRETHMGEKYGLSSTMRRASEMNHIKKIIQVGARGIGSGHPKDYKDALEWGVKFYTADKVHSEGTVEILNEIDKNAKVIICIDIDSMDPSIAPNTIGRVPGGLTYFQVLNIIKDVSKKAKIVTIDFVEIMPEVDIDGIGGLTVSRLIAATMGIIARKNR
ncbi:MAG: N(1)-aminopropylagmatine ureohydrolase [Alphaproteobacteria bacterium MarineAlpha5_Bin12]|nr:MAG: N(1)-aminopropylagmatine ureohydrolase [Alphaproteobacteria bacterium MarineAlpha5_Bin12]|tara:strand:- start:625 stop:1578 length:954 start_codon:yes stop_codon:yes gene_type:complete